MQKLKILVGIKVVLLTILCPFVFAQEPVLQERISDSGSGCSNPCIIVSKTDDTFAVWQGVKNSRSRIFFRERKGKIWTQEILLDRSESGDNTDAGIALDEQGNPYVVWSLADAEISSIQYAFRLKGEWIYSQPLREIKDKNCEFPCIAIERGTNRTFVAWQEGRGSQYAIYCATQDSSGRFVPVQLSRQGAQGYNVYPEIFIAPSPVITWYGVNDSNFVLRVALFNMQTEKWMRYDPAGLENLPANRLPFLMTDADGILHAVWYDSDGSTDRIYFARQEDASFGKGVIVDDNPERMNNTPFGMVGQDKNLYLCWRGESLFGGQIFLTVGVPQATFYDFKESHLVSDGQKLFYTQPDCYTYSDGSVGLVWISSALDGGDGSVYFRNVLP